MECFMPRLDVAVLLQASHNGFPSEAMPISLGIAKIQVKTTSGKRGWVSLACSYVDTRSTCASKTCGQVFDKFVKEHALEPHTLCVFFGVCECPQKKEGGGVPEKKRPKKASVVLLTS